MSSLDSDAWMKLNIDALEAWYRGVGGANPNAEVIERDGVVAIVSPKVPERSLFNAVVYTDPGAMAAAREELAAAYAEQGCAWTVWVPGDDRETGEMLEGAGHMLDASPRAMGIDLDGYPEPDLSGIDWRDKCGFEDLCSVNERAFGLEPGSWVTGFGGLPAGSHTYSAVDGGEPVAVLLTFDHPGPAGPDSSVWAVGTLPEARGRGLSTALMRRALWDAAERGCATSTLQATKLGVPVYLKAGYGDFGAIEMWEFRTE